MCTSAMMAPMMPITAIDMPAASIINGPEKRSENAEESDGDCPLESVVGPEVVFISSLYAWLLS